MALNKSSNKMVIAMIVIVVILVSGIGVFYVRKNKKNDMDNSTQMVKNDSDMDNTWIVDDKLEDDISNGYMDNNEEDSFAINDENQMQENISEDTILTGSVSTTETEPPAVIKPTETTKPMETSSPVVITTAAPTLSPLPTASPVSTPMPTIAPAPTIVPVSTPTPTATPQPVVTQYASLVNPYTSKDSNGQIVYVLANSNNRYYSESELQSLTKEQLRFARNEIFARRGGIFTSSDLQQYFSSRSWYVPTRNAADFEDEDVNAYELANIKLIQAVEKTK